jgi:hypothetical protein
MNDTFSFEYARENDIFSLSKLDRFICFLNLAKINNPPLPESSLEENFNFYGSTTFNIWILIFLYFLDV